MKYSAWMTLIVLGLAAAPAAAQTATVVQKEKVAAGTGERLATEIVSKMSVAARVMKGAPYTAETVSESVQVLGDGNKIVNRTTTRVYRDSEGRTRTEQLSGNDVRSISISDPVAGTTYMLNPATQTAYKTGAVIIAQGGNRVLHSATPGTATFVATTTPDGTVRMETRELKTKMEQEATAAAGAVAAARTPGTFTYTTEADGGGTRMAFVTVNDANTAREELGEQVIEGVTASGTRLTTVVPAGAMGNERPITIVSEQWLCKDLGILVLTKHSDPRSGETTYRVTNISRLEPDPSLFQLPAEYKVQQSMIRRESR